MALLGILRIPQVHHKVDVIAAVRPSNVLAVVRPRACILQIYPHNLTHHLEYILHITIRPQSAVRYLHTVSTLNVVSQVYHHTLA